MPHVVFNQKIDLEKFSIGFEKFELKESCIIKIHNIFVDKMKRVALLPTIVIDEKNQQFLLKFQQGKERLQ